jgi:hypothetical protein
MLAHSQTHTHAKQVYPEDGKWRTMRRAETAFFPRNYPRTHTHTHNHTKQVYPEDGKWRTMRRAETAFFPRTSTGAGTSSASSIRLTPVQSGFSEIGYPGWPDREVTRGGSKAATPAATRSTPLQVSFAGADTRSYAFDDDDDDDYGYYGAPEAKLSASSGTRDSDIGKTHVSYARDTRDHTTTQSNRGRSTTFAPTEFHPAETDRQYSNGCQSNHSEGGADDLETDRHIRLEQLPTTAYTNASSMYAKQIHTPMTANTHASSAYTKQIHTPMTANTHASSAYSRQMQTPVTANTQASSVWLQSPTVCSGNYNSTFNADSAALLRRNRSAEVIVCVCVCVCVCVFVFVCL